MRSIAFVAAVAAPLASAGLVTAPNGGPAIVNNCNFDISMSNVPAILAGVENAVASTHTLSKNGGTYNTNWVQLLSGGGWSMKLDPLGNGQLMQYEYTYKEDGQIWYDMSYVGVPEQYWNQFPAWSFNPGVMKYYRSYNDDSNGMQVPVQSDQTVTLELCPGSGGSSGSSSGSGNSAPSTPTTTTEAPAPAPTTLQTSAAPVSLKQAAAVQPAAVTTTTSQAPAPAPTTTQAPAPASAAVAEDDSGAVVVTEFETKIVTAVVTELAHARNRRRHAHGHQHHGHPQ